MNGIDIDIDTYKMCAVLNGLINVYKILGEDSFEISSDVLKRNNIDPYNLAILARSLGWVDSYENYSHNSVIICK